MDGLAEWTPSQSAYRVNPGSPWDDLELYGTFEDEDSVRYADGDAVSEAVEAARVEALIDAGYTVVYAQSQAYGYDPEIEPEERTP